MNTILVARLPAKKLTSFFLINTLKQTQKSSFRNHSTTIPERERDVPQIGKSFFAEPILLNFVHNFVQDLFSYSYGYYHAPLFVRSCARSLVHACARACIQCFVRSFRYCAYRANENLNRIKRLTLEDCDSPIK